MSLSAAERRRKAVHIGAGFFALGLRVLSWEEAALAALAALAFNLFVLPRAGGGLLMRKADVERGYPVGILLYPVVVLALIVLFRGHLEVAAAGWAFLAAGDGSATLAGSLLGGPRLPWNRGKTWAGLAAYVVVGGAAAAALYGLVARRVPTAFEIACLLAAAVIGAAVESLPSELDDNVLPPLVAAAALAALLPARAGFEALLTPEWARRAAIGFALNLAVALAAGLLGLVRPSGAAAGAASGTVVYAFGGPKAYALLWIFFVLGTLATRFGRKRKEAMGKAEEAGGRRGAANVFANVSVAAFCTVVWATLPAEAAPPWGVAAAAAFATALMDTVGTEVGQAVRTPTVLLPDFRRVPPGTDGAVSVAGTLAGLFAAGFVAAAAVDLGFATPRGGIVVLAAAAAGTVAESLLGRSGAPWRVTNGHVLNFMNTLAGAAVALALA